jgi:hypothetical protein
LSLLRFRGRLSVYFPPFGFTASDGVSVRIYSPAKTVADCFKFRNKTGLDVAIEALREVLRTKRCTREELWAAGKACRVTTVIRPYLEAL